MKVTVTKSAIIEAPVVKVWALLRDFNSHRRWHPAITDSRMENDFDGDVVGGVRRFNLEDGAELREQLLHHSDRDRAITYSILDSPLPLFDYISTMRLKPVTDGNHTFCHWHAQFRAPRDRAAELETIVGRQIYEAGFTGLRRFLAGGGTPSQLSIEEPSDSEIPSVKGEELLAKAIVVTEVGDAGKMSLQDETVPAPEAHQVRIRHTAIAVNYLDIKHRRGIAAGFDLPGTPGVEAVGEVIDMGNQVNGLFHGDRVAYICRTPGSYTSIRCVDAANCVPIPQGISNLKASALLKGVTAAILLSRVFRPAPGAFIMVDAAAGGIGHLLCQWAKSMDLTVIGTVSTEDKARFSRDHGCDYPLVPGDDQQLADQVMRITNGRGADYWVQSGSAQSMDTAVACMARLGHLAVIGDRDGGSASLDVDLLRRRSLTVAAPVCFDYLDHPPYLQRLAHNVFAKFQSRAIIPTIDSLPLNQAAKAHGLIESRQNTGAIVLSPVD